ncbi:MAG: GntR family transcriptional regulator [Deltaproteobacteria bacterium]|jgi:GntR family transcriptional regulator|nr:GntR family transcriptional regulator [Deltaproteobacteria bacterium]
MRTPVENKLQAIDIKSSVKGPAYAQLAGIIKDKIGKGEFPPGSRIPAEVTMSKTFGVAVMTVRQAIRVLAEKGYLRRVHGSGTFVCGPDWKRASFTMGGLLRKLGDRENLDIKILSAGISEATANAAEFLNIEPGDLYLSMIRLVAHKGTPLLLNRAFLKYEPKSPIVEMELDPSSLFSLFTGENSGFIKKTELVIEPAILQEEDAGFLELPGDTLAHKIRYTVFGYDDEPSGTGWFLTHKDNIAFSARLGVWDDDF